MNRIERHAIARMRPAARLHITGNVLGAARAQQRAHPDFPREVVIGCWHLAAHSAMCCGRCFRDLAPTATVTMTSITVGESGYRNGRFRHAPRLTVPICIDCWLSDPHEWHSGLGRLRQRLRCEGCGRPMRAKQESARSSHKLTDRVCCHDCYRRARNTQANTRRRVEHHPTTCAGCGETFTPTRTDAVTCSNRCRQKLHRQRARDARRTPRQRTLPKRR